MIAFCIMSHGQMINNKLHVFFSCGTTCPLEELIAPILECQDLINKPKLFFNQLCRGDANINQQMLPDNPVYSAQEGRYYHATKDRCVFHSTAVGNLSFRSDETGSVFVNHLSSAGSAPVNT